MKCVPSPVVFGLLLVSLAPAQPVQWPISQGGNDHYYEAVELMVDWYQAQQMATLAGGHLATIGSMAENTFVHALISDPRFWFLDGAGNSEGPWLGGFQAPGSSEPSGGWQWVTGEPWSYTNWEIFEPNNSGGMEDHLVFFGLGYPNFSPKWNDVTGYSTLHHGFVVEYPGAVSIIDYPGSGEDLELRSGVNQAPSHGPPVDIKGATAGDALVLQLISPNATFDYEPMVLVGEFFATGGTLPVGPLPGVWVSIGGLFPVVAASPGGWVPLLNPGGTLVAFAVPGGLSGLSVMLQGAVVSPASTLGIAFSDAHEIQVQ